jgi:hypothetical protein
MPDYADEFSRLARALDNNNLDKSTTEVVAAIVYICKDLSDFERQLGKRIEFLISKVSAASDVWPPDTNSPCWRQAHSEMMRQFGNYVTALANVFSRSSYVRRWLEFHHSTAYADAFGKRMDDLLQDAIAANDLQGRKTPDLVAMMMRLSIGAEAVYLFDLAHMIIDKASVASANKGHGDTGRKASGKQQSSPTAEEANILARDYLKKNPNAKLRELADEIECSTGLIAKLPVWKAVMEARKQGKKPKPRAIRLTDKILATTNADDELRRLVEEQDRDQEASPLDRKGRSPRVYPSL